MSQRGRYLQRAMKRTAKRRALAKSPAAVIADYYRAAGWSDDRIINLLLSRRP